MASEKKKSAALLLSIFLGMFGVHRMYVGKFGTGILQFVLTITFFFWWVSAIWVLVDFAMIVTDNFKDIQKRPLTNW